MPQLTQQQGQSGEVSLGEDNQGEALDTPVPQERVAEILRRRQRCLEQGRRPRVVGLTHGHDTQMIVGDKRKPRIARLHQHGPGRGDERPGSRVIATVFRRDAKEQDCLPFPGGIPRGLGKRPCLLEVGPVGRVAHVRCQAPGVKQRIQPASRGPGRFPAPGFA